MMMIIITKYCLKIKNYKYENNFLSVQRQKATCDIYFFSLVAMNESLRIWKCPGSVITSFGARYNELQLQMQQHHHQQQQQQLYFCLI